MDLEEGIQKIDNLVIFLKEGRVKVIIDKSLYSMEIIYSSVYIMSESSYVVIERESDDLINVYLKPKEQDSNLEKLGMDLNNELINNAVYKTQSDRNVMTRDSIIQASLITNQKSDDSKELDEVFDDTSYLDDTFQISKPWDN